MSVFRCTFCSTPVQFMNTKFGKRMLFDAMPIAAAQDSDCSGWIPGSWTVGRGTRTVMAPVKHYSTDKRSRVRHVVMLHACAERQALDQTA